MLLRPDVYSFDFGAFRIAALLDATDIRGGLAASFALGEPDAHVRELAVTNFIDPDRFEHPFIPIFIDTGAAKILFDTGLGAPESALLPSLARIGVAPGVVDIVVLTHGHPDHIGGLRAGASLVFPRARYVFGAAEFDFWVRGENVRQARRADRELFMRSCAPLADSATFVNPGDEILPGISAIDAAGHSPGLLAWRIASEGKQLLIWSDTCLHYIVSLQRPDWQATVDDDKEKAAGTRRHLLAFAADERLLVAGYHMPFPGLGFVERVKDTFRWIPVSYQLNL
ncbi:MBL fold metallo-hydrolase [Nordella sp. HKS 07]|uniref:MBL fold metallo-hydrolase n=1 Tax=Nordella sp. HKS 07 TaxID=2712222 RepID=UPI0013E1EB40|nr:MBL fold metallo-hydrolase [Nordella sp. HKS 07]QIG51946.1 MBL fold metallo-hydrolase [Nordella sp. HKS 07]